MQKTGCMARDKDAAPQMRAVAHLRPAILIFYTGSAMFPQTASHATISQNLPNGLGLLLSAMFFPGMHPSSAGASPDTFDEVPYYFRGASPDTFGEVPYYFRGASADTFDEVPYYFRGASADTFDEVPYYFRGSPPFYTSAHPCCYCLFFFIYTALKH